MNATAKKGTWEETLNPDTKLIFDTSRTPERISVQHKGNDPVHFDYEEGITEKDIIDVRSKAMESFKIEESKI